MFKLSSISVYMLPFRQFTFFILFLFLSQVSHAQVKVFGIELDSVALQVKQNPEYLTALNEKILDPNAYLEPSNYFLLYYGSAYLENYNPYGESLMKKVVRELLNEKKYKEAIDLAKAQIKENPGYIRPLFYLGIAYEALGDELNANIYFEKFYNYISVPYSSGTGESFDSAYVVRSIDDEYLILGELGISVGSQSLNFNEGIPFDILYSEADEGETAEKYYFNIIQPFTLGFKDLFEEEPSKKEKKKKKKLKKS